MGRLLVIVGNYTELRSVETVTQFTEVASVENRVSIERMRCNELARGNRTTIATFPSGFIASMCDSEGRDNLASGPGTNRPPREDLR